MLHILLSLSVIFTNVSLASSNQHKKRDPVREACDPLAASLCCPLLQMGFTLSNQIVMPMITRDSANLISPTPALQCAAAAATCLTPYVARFTTECCCDKTCCADPIETCCPGIQQGRCLPAIALACKGPATVLAIGANVAIVDACPSLAKVYEFLPDFCECGKDAGVLCVGYETLAASTCMGHFATDYCCDKAARLYACCNKLDCYNATEEPKKD